MTEYRIKGHKNNRFHNDNGSTLNNEDFKELLINQISADDKILDY